MKICECVSALRVASVVDVRGNTSARPHISPWQTCKYQPDSSIVIAGVPLRYKIPIIQLSMPKTQLWAAIRHWEAGSTTEIKMTEVVVPRDSGTHICCLDVRSR